MARRNKVRYEFGKKDKNNKSFDAFLMSGQVLEPTMEVTYAMKRRAEAMAPESRDNRGMPYAWSFQVDVKDRGLIPDRGRYRNRRVACELINTAEHAPAIEFGLEDEESGGPRPARRIMLRAGLIMSPNQRSK